MRAGQWSHMGWSGAVPAGAAAGDEEEGAEDQEGGAGGDEHGQLPVVVRHSECRAAGEGRPVADVRQRVACAGVNRRPAEWAA